MAASTYVLVLLLAAACLASAAPRDEDDYEEGRPHYRRGYHGEDEEGERYEHHSGGHYGEKEEEEEEGRYSEPHKHYRDSGIVGPYNSILHGPDAGYDHGYGAPCPNQCPHGTAATEFKASNAAAATALGITVQTTNLAAAGSASAASNCGPYCYVGGSCLIVDSATPGDARLLTSGINVPSALGVSQTICTAAGSAGSVTATVVCCIPTGSYGGGGYGGGGYGGGGYGGFHGGFHGRRY